MIGLVAAIAVPVTTTTLHASHARAAAHYVASRMTLARSEAARRSSSVAILFAEEPEGVVMHMFVDGNGNGVRRADVDSGVDIAIREPSRLHELFPGVRIGLRPELAGEGEAVRFGDSRLVSFSAVGTATPGSVHVLGRDLSQYAVRVFGATARTRVLRYRVSDAAWVER
jgi:hypothetical protein